MENSISIDIKPQNKINNNNWKDEKYLNDSSLEKYEQEKSSYYSYEENRDFKRDDDKKNNFILNFFAKILNNGSKLVNSPWVGPTTNNNQVI